MDERFLHYIWHQSLYEKEDLRTTAGEKVEVIRLGEKNIHAGPDFFNAKIQIGETIWAGNVEVHCKSSDWIRHNHHVDKAYQNTILHVVKDFDKAIKRDNGIEIPTLILKYDKKYEDSYGRLIKECDELKCSRSIKLIDVNRFSFWLNKLVIERVEYKSKRIIDTLRRTKNDWEETLYIELARSFGFKTNSLPFELLATSTPLKIIRKIGFDDRKIEALLFGQAGFLNEDAFFDVYFRELKKEYGILKKLYGLSEMDKSLWKFLRLRPLNFPSMRISQFGDLMSRNNGLMSNLLKAKTYKEMQCLLECKVAPYWEEHYVFGKSSTRKQKKIGQSAINTLIVNTFVPFAFVYAHMHGDEDRKEIVVDILNQIPAENNSIVKKWNALGIEANSSSCSQALIHLTEEFCRKGKCLHCQIGNDLIRKHKTV